MFNRSKKKESKDPVPAETVSAAAAPAPVTAGAEISAEIIAVLTAAITAMTGSESVGTDGFIVRKISRVHGEKVSWCNAGLMECIDSRKI